MTVSELRHALALVSSASDDVDVTVVDADGVHYNVSGIGPDKDNEGDLVMAISYEV